MVYIHSFYYSIVSLFVVGLYALHRMMQKKEWHFGRLFLAVFVSVGMALVFLLPTGLDILSTAKDGGSFAEEALRAVDFSLSGLLYSTYGCGMTLLTLYALLLSLGKKGRRLLAGISLACMLFPAASLLFNGFLYARTKILIPFVPVLALITAETLEELLRKRRTFAVLPLVCCLVPALFSPLRPLILADAGIVAAWVLWKRLEERRFFPVKKGALKRMGAALTVVVFGFTLLVSFGTNAGGSYLAETGKKLGIHVAGQYLKASDRRQEVFTKEEIEEVIADKGYRFENIANNFVNSNLLPSGSVKRASMYSSVTNDAYADFFYNTIGNAISANNRVALTPGKNPFFLYLMGVRYVLGEKDLLPEGYQVLKEKGNYVLAENKNVLPVCYGTTDLILPKACEGLSFPDRLAAFGSCVTASGAPKEADAFGKKFERITPEELKELTGKIVVIRFHVENPDGRAVEITINGVKNKLSADSAPYPNENHDFTYVLGPEELEKGLTVKASEGNFKISDVEIYAADADVLGNMDVILPRETRETPGRLQFSSDDVYSGSINMEEEGYFVTSYPFREGYEIMVDGRVAEAEKVNEVFVGVPLTKGQHTIEIRFTAPGFPVGFLGSVLFCGVFVCMRILEGNRMALRRRQKSIYTREESEVVILKYL